MSILVSDVRLPFPFSEEEALTAARKKLRLSPDSVLRGCLHKQSLDLRHGDLKAICSVELSLAGDEAAFVRKKNDPHVKLRAPAVMPVPSGKEKLTAPPVAVGFGPAGMFAALILALAGWRPLVLERGEDAQARHEKVRRFFETGELDPKSNVQFGEGGAGTFSDGKLNTGVNDPRIPWVLEQFVKAGAREDILYDAKPHVGTDYLHIALVNLRRQLLSLGADIRFESQLTDITVEDGHLAAVTVAGPEGTYVLPCRQLVLCPGHSARDTFAMLYERSVPMEAKPFAVGVRIEHRQSDCDAAQYKQYASCPGLPASTYKLSCHLEDGRAAYSFCVCPGGTVVAAASEEGRVCTNGMSEFARDKENINGAFLVNVTPEDFGGEHDPLAGIAFQRSLEEAAYVLGGSNFCAPAQRVEDFLAGRPSDGPGRVQPSYRPGVKWADLHDCLPDFICETLEGALPILGRKLAGYDHPDAVLTAVESRSSSPVRIPRDETYQSAIRGLYPCGEGAGYAGGILSAAADGMKTAERVCDAIRNR